MDNENMLEEKYVDNEKGNEWLHGDCFCFSCGYDLRSEKEWQLLTGCPQCNRSFVE